MKRDTEGQKTKMFYIGFPYAGKNREVSNWWEFIVGQLMCLDA